MDANWTDWTVAEAALRAHVEALAGRIGERNTRRPAAYREAADYIAGCWRSQGYEVAEQRFAAAGEDCVNLEVSRTGQTLPERILLLGAHYDTVVGGPGANDNGSGVAALIEIARLFAGLDPAVTVRFVAFANEEPPYFATRLQGSEVYAKAARARGDDIRLMASLETIGCYFDAPGSQTYPLLFGLFHPDRGNFLGLVSNFRSRRRLLQLAAAFRAVSDFPLEHSATFGFVPGVSWSDHRAFWRRGYRALMVTDTAFHRYAYYHTPEDTPDKLTYPAFAEATTGLARAFAKLAMEDLAA